MSSKAVGWAIALERVTPNQKLICIILGDHYSAEGYCHPGLRKLAQLTGLHRATVIRNLEQLEAGGLVRRRGRRDKGGRVTSNQYDLVGFELGLTGPVTESHGATLSESYGATLPESHGATLPESHGATPGGRMVRPEPPRGTYKKKTKRGSARAREGACETPHEESWLELWAETPIELRGGTEDECRKAWGAAARAADPELVLERWRQRLAAHVAAGSLEWCIRLRTYLRRRRWEEDPAAVEAAARQHERAPPGGAQPSAYERELASEHEAYKRAQRHGAAAPEGAGW